MNSVVVILKMIGKFWGVLLDKENGRILLELTRVRGIQGMAF